MNYRKLADVVSTYLVSKEQEGPAQRPRWAGEYTEPYELLKEHVKAVNQLQYSKELDGALGTDEIGRQSPLLQACRQLTGGRAFKKSMIKQAFRKLGSKQFSVPKRDLEAYVSLNSDRLLDMMRVVAQAVRKDKVPAWAVRFVPAEERLQRATKKRRQLALPIASRTC